MDNVSCTLYEDVGAAVSEHSLISMGMPIGSEENSWKQAFADKTKLEALIEASKTTLQALHGTDINNAVQKVETTLEKTK